MVSDAESCSDYCVILLKVMNYSYDLVLFEQPKQIKHAFDPDFKQWH